VAIQILKTKRCHKALISMEVLELNDVVAKLRRQFAEKNPLIEKLQ
jgi:hypothetical protein